MERVNVLGAEFEYDEDDPPGYRCSAVKVAEHFGGGGELAVNAFEVPAGETLCPYHYEYVEEWLLVLQGDVVVRSPDGEQSLQRGDLVRFPSGPQGAHKLSNRSDATAMVLMFSSGREPAVAVYPDSDKIGVWSGNPDDKVMLWRQDGQVGYYEGEA